MIFLPPISFLFETFYLYLQHVFWLRNKKELARLLTTNPMDDLSIIFEAINQYGFDENTIHLINKHVNNIENGRTNISRFTIPEHAGLCSAGAPLIGASIIASYARTSLEASYNARKSQGSSPTNWQIDQLQEQLIEKWAKNARLWIDNSEQILSNQFGPKIAQGAESKVYYREGDTSVVKITFFPRQLCVLLLLHATEMGLCV